MLIQINFERIGKQGLFFLGLVVKAARAAKVALAARAVRAAKADSASEAHSPRC